MAFLLSKYFVGFTGFSQKYFLLPDIFVGKEVHALLGLDAAAAGDADTAHEQGQVADLKSNPIFEIPDLKIDFHKSLKTLLLQNEHKTKKT